MNKFKKILLGTLSVLTLGLFVATGARVDAATSTTNYTYDVKEALKNTTKSDMNLVASGKDVDYIISASETGKEYSKLNLNIGNTSSKAIKAVKENGGITYQKSATRDTGSMTITFKTKGSATLTMTLNTGGKTKPYYYTIDNDDSKYYTGGNVHYVVSSSAKEFSFDFDGAGEHTLFIREATAEEFTSVNGTSGDNQNLKITGLTIVDKQVVESSATIAAFQQEGKSGDYTYVRFIFIASGYTDLSSANLTNALTLVLDAGEENEKTVTRTPRVVTRITNNGNTYVGKPGDDSYEFDNATNTDDVYIIYVVKFTTATYLTHTIKAVLNYGSSYSTTAYTFV